jgi:hypothetical protein
MSGKSVLVVLVATTVLGASISSSVAGGDDKGDRLEKGGAVVPCSLDGVNPAFHPDIFGNPAAAARDYGFVRSPDGTWHVGAGCGASGSPPAASAYVPHPESQKATRQRRR